MKFIKYNANPKKWKTSDCVVRALSVATQEDWLKTYDKLYEIGRKKCRMPNNDKTYKAYLKEKGFEEMKQIKNENTNGKLTVQEIVDMYPNSILIISCKHHLTVSIKGNIVDIWNTAEEKAYKFWKKDINKDEESNIIKYLESIDRRDKMEEKPRRVRL